MGLRPGLPKLAATRRRVALLVASIQLASTARRDKITDAHQPPRLIREQPIEAPQLAPTPTLPRKQGRGRKAAARIAPSPPCGGGLGGGLRTVKRSTSY